MSKCYAGAVAVTVAAAVAVAAGQAARQGTKHAPLFTAQQVAQGKRLYAAKCATCHGENLLGGAAGPLTGPGFAACWTSGWGDSKLTVDDLDFIIRTTMPKGSPATMRPEEYTAVLTYILQQNGYPAGTAALANGAAGLKDAKITP